MARRTCVQTSPSQLEVEWIADELWLLAHRASTTKEQFMSTIVSLLHGYARNADSNGSPPTIAT